jgi:hypothetical protein
MGSCYSSQDNFTKEDRDRAIEYLGLVDSELQNLTMVLDCDRKYRETTRLLNSLKKDLLIISFNKESDIIRTELETRLRILRSL